MKVIKESTAWDAIGWDNGPFRIKGGRAIYQAVMFNCATHGDQVKLARLEVTADRKIREVSRYVAPETMLEFIEESTKTSDDS